MRRSLLATMRLPRASSSVVGCCLNGCGPLLHARAALSNSSSNDNAEQNANANTTAAASNRGRHPSKNTHHHSGGNCGGGCPDTKSETRSATTKVPPLFPQSNVAVSAATTATNFLRRRAPVAGGGGSSSSSSPSSTTTTAPGAVATEATIGIKLSPDDELTRAFNRFSVSVGGCSDTEFLQGAEQVYYSTAVLTGLLSEHATPIPGTLKLESANVLVAADEARELIDKELMPEKKWKKTQTSVVELEDMVASVGDGNKAQEKAIQRVVSAITSVLPMSTHLAETLFKVWCLQKEKKANLLNIAAPTDYVLDTRLVVFARLDSTKIYFAERTGITGGLQVAFAADYLQQQEKFVRDAEDGAMHEETISFSADGSASFANSETTTTTVITPNLSSSSATVAAAFNDEQEKRKMTTTTVIGGGGEVKDTKKSSRVDGNGASVVMIAEDGKQQQQQQHNQQLSKATTSAVDNAQDTAVDGVDGPVSVNVDMSAVEAVYIKVNGSPLPPIPPTARACALVTMDVVVPPERYANHYEWYYNRIVGYESEYERIAAARMFAMSTPKGVASFFDFVTRMFTGKPVEFMFSKAIGKMIGLPENVSECPPATRKLVCMYMDQTRRWVLSDLIPVTPITSTKLPSANGAKN